MLFELRQYRIREGRMAEWVRLMEEEIIPFQVARGMVILGSFTAEGDPDAYVWLRRFKDEEERLRLYKAVYQSDHWRERIAPRVSEMLIREEIKVSRLLPTPKSPLQ
ncbi:MAG TPA: NIPSNAP family protein [Dehalococcoidia bacterium]|nr:NIPSNAP family protein [Dehalococcoidia bacterium]